MTSCVCTNCHSPNCGCEKMNNRRIESRLYWKVLSDDGLLKDPEEQGPHYDRRSVNLWHIGDYKLIDGFSFEEEAVHVLRKFVDEHDCTFNYDTLVLIKEFRIR